MTGAFAVELRQAFAGAFDVALDESLFARSTGVVAAPIRTTRDLEVSLRDLEPSLPGPGAMIDKYVLERPIGLGGFAVVYRARHAVLDTMFALKLLRPSVLRQRPELVHLLGQEARLAAKLHHPNVVRIHDVTVGGAHSYIVMEHIAGPDLSAMLRHKGLLPARMVLRIVEHVAAALAAGLEHRLVHRDIKPSNILLTREGITKLVDFGLARSHELRGERGAVVGTLGYMSPEQIESPNAVDHRSDIFSLGVTAYRALTGVLPVQATSATQMLAALRSSAITPPHRLNAKVDTAVSQLIMWMLQIDPAQRPRDYASIIAAARAHAASGRLAAPSK